MKTEKNKDRKGTITEIIDDKQGTLGYKPGYVKITDEKGDSHIMRNGSANQVNG